MHTHTHTHTHAHTHTHTYITHTHPCMLYKYMYESSLLYQPRMIVFASRRYNPFALDFLTYYSVFCSIPLQWKQASWSSFRLAKQGISSKFQYSDGVKNLVFGQDIYPYQENSHARALPCAHARAKKMHKNYHLKHEIYCSPVCLPRFVMDYGLMMWRQSRRVSRCVLLF